MKTAHAVRAAALLAAAAGTKAARALWIEPLAVEDACRAGAAPAAACAARDAVLWMQVHHGFGALAVALGAAALALRLPFRVSGIAFACGTAAALGYDATLGVAGASMAAWSWISPPGRARDGAPSAG